MNTIFEFKTGTCVNNENLDGWVISSSEAVVVGAEDLPLMRGDQIRINGDVYRKNVFIANIA